MLAIALVVAATPVAAWAQVQTPVLRVGANVTEPRKIKDVKPEYPAMAQTARISGVVVAEIVVATNGDVRSVAVVRGVPMLNDAAVDAIRQWRYVPTLLNGAPVEVLMTVTVSFTLDDSAPIQTNFDAPVNDAAARTAWADATRIGGAIKEPRKIRDVKPVYPALAQAAQVTGIVIAEIVVGADGSVVDTNILRSVPMLNDAALEAIRQWEYEPTFVNGVAVPVVMTVTVNFSLK